MQPDLSVDLAPGRKFSLPLRNPVMPASGTFSWGLEFARHFDINRLGAVVSKGVTMAPRGGNPQPRVAETPAGMLNSIGLQNIGIHECITAMAPAWARWDVPVIVNIAADSVEEFGEMARMLDGVPGIAGIELNISCPNVDTGGMEIGQSVEASARATRAAVRNTDLPVIVKLTPNVTDPVAWRWPAPGKAPPPSAPSTPSLVLLSIPGGANRSCPAPGAASADRRSSRSLSGSSTTWPAPSPSRSSAAAASRRGKTPSSS